MPADDAAENPFYLPVHAAGLGEQSVQNQSTSIGLAAVPVAAAAIAAALLSGWTNASGWTLAGDAVFLPVRLPRVVEAVASGPSASAGGWVLMGVAILAFAVAASPAVCEAVRLMTSRLAGMDLPTWRLRRQGGARPLAMAFLICLAAMVAGWFALLTPSEPMLLRVVRLLALGFLAEIVCLVLGGALACVGAEGESGSAALARQLGLIWGERGRFLRLAVYSLPRWLAVTVLSWAIVAAGTLLPFFIAHHLLAVWLAFLAPTESTWLAVGRVALVILLGLVLLSAWGVVLKSSRHRLVRAAGVAGLISTVWCLFVLPWVRESVVSGSWFAAAAGHLLDGRTELPDVQVKICLILVGAFLVLVTFGQVGLCLVVYPLALGVCSFFVLRRHAEGVRFRSTGGVTQTRRHTTLSAPGALLFSRDGPTALGTLSPPRGWVALIWVGLRFELLVGALLAAGVCFYLARGPVLSDPWVRGAAVAVALAFVSLPLLCRGVSRQLTRRPLFAKNGLLPAPLIAVFIVGAWGLFLVDKAFMAGVIAIGASLGLIPGIGPIVWAVIFPVMLLAVCSLLVWGTLVWVPSNLILPVVAAIDVGASSRPGDLLRQTEHYGGAAPWSFLGGLLAGLPFALVPAAITGGPLVAGLALWTRAHGEPWMAVVDNLVETLTSGRAVAGSLDTRLLGVLAVLTAALLVLGLAVALTNAYLIVRQVSAEAPFRVGDLVILGRHETVESDDNWAPEMEAFVGRPARITMMAGKDMSGCDVVRVDVDRGAFAWRLTNLTRA